MKYKIFSLIMMLSLLLCGCTSSGNDALQNDTSEQTSEVVSEVVEEPTAEELHETATYKSFYDTYYSEVPKEVAKLVVFLECTRENSNATFSDRYFSYFEYENMESVLASYYEVLGCTYEAEQLEAITVFYKENSSWQQLCQDMYDGIISSGKENLSLIMDTLSIQTQKESQEFKLVPYEYQKELSGTDWFSLETDAEGYAILYANNSELTFYKLVYTEDETVYSYFVTFPKSCFLINNGTGIVVKGGNNFVYLSSAMVHDSIKHLCATTHLYPVEGKFDKTEMNAYENWLKETNTFAGQTDELIFYQEMVDSTDLKFPLYIKDNRMYQPEEYLHLFPVTARVDNEGLKTEYGLCIEDLSMNASK